MSPDIPSEAVPPSLHLTLQRVVVEDFGAFGVLKSVDFEGVERILCCTLERTYRNEGDAGVAQRYERVGGPQFVKIQHGTWTCKQTWFVRGGYTTFEVEVPGHTEILFHKGSIEGHSEGCVLLGTGFTGDAIYGAPEALRKFLTFTKGVKQFTLEVRE